MATPSACWCLTQQRLMTHCECMLLQVLRVHGAVSAWCCGCVVAQMLALGHAYTWCAHVVARAWLKTICSLAMLCRGHGMCAQARMHHMRAHTCARTHALCLSLSLTHTHTHTCTHAPPTRAPCAGAGTALRCQSGTWRSTGSTSTCRATFGSLA